MSVLRFSTVHGSVLVDATSANTGFTRVLARPQGVLSQSRPAATEFSSLAVLSLAAMSSSPVLSRGNMRLGRETVIRLDWLLSMITARRKLASGRRCHLLEAVDPTPCSTSTTPLAAPNRLSQQPTTGPLSRTTLVASPNSRLPGNGTSGSQQACSATRRSHRAASTPINAAHASELRGPSRFSDGRARPSSASEQVWTSRTVTSTRTRNQQRVLHEERDARQCAPAGREPHRHR